MCLVKLDWIYLDVHLTKDPSFRRPYRAFRVNGIIIMELVWCSKQVGAFSSATSAASRLN